MKDKKNKILLSIIIFLVLIILGLFIILFIPKKEDDLKYSSDDFINVKNNINVQNLNNIINSEISKENTSELDTSDIENDSDFTSISNNHLFSVDEDYVLQYAEINYYKEDCLQLINKNIVSQNLNIEEDSNNKIIYQRDCFGDEGFFRVFKVYNNQQNTYVDSIAVNLETGDMFGLTPEGILYDYRTYDYNPEWIEYNENHDWTQYETIVPFDNVQLWDNISKVVNFEKFPTQKLTHFFDNEGNEYYKWTTSNSDAYLLIDYYNGDMFQVVNGEKSSEITAFN